MIDAQIQLGDLKIVLEASQKAEAESRAAKEAAERQLASQTSDLDRLRSRLAGAEAEMDDLRSQVRCHASCAFTFLHTSPYTCWPERAAIGNAELKQLQTASAALCMTHCFEQRSVDAADGQSGLACGNPSAISMAAMTFQIHIAPVIAHLHCAQQKRCKTRS